jgi:hypothetical protein
MTLMLFLEPRAFCIQNNPNVLYDKDIAESQNSKDSAWHTFLSWSEKTDLPDHIYLADEPERCFHDLSQNFNIIEAAGGVVENPNNQVLMIFRLGKWDLPKGKVDTGETFRKPPSER